MLLLAAALAWHDGLHERCELGCVEASRVFARVEGVGKLLQADAIVAQQRVKIMQQVSCEK